jgi:hypothetical protein
MQRPAAALGRRQHRGERPSCLAAWLRGSAQPASDPLVEVSNAVEGGATPRSSRLA